MTPARETKNAHHMGSAATALEWQQLEVIFDAMFGADARSLPAYPKVIGGVGARWLDAKGHEHDATHLDDLRTAYESHATASLRFSGQLEGTPHGYLSYWPGDPRPRVEAVVRGVPRDVDSIMTLIRDTFPLAFEGSLIFVSWSGPLSSQVAAALRPLLESRLPAANVFLSSTSIELGDDPNEEDS